MNWQVSIGRNAEKAFAQIPEKTRSRIGRAILELEKNPFPQGCKKLKNRDGWRIRVGDYRVLYFADSKLRRILVGVIGHRRDVYRD